MLSEIITQNFDKLILEKLAFNNCRNKLKDSMQKCFNLIISFFIIVLHFLCCDIVKKHLRKCSWIRNLYFLSVSPPDSKTIENDFWVGDSLMNLSFRFNHTQGNLQLYCISIYSLSLQ